MGTNSQGPSIALALLCGPNHWNHYIESVPFQCIMLFVDTFNVSPLGQSKARQTRSFSRNVSDSNHESWHHGVAYKKRMVFSWFSMSWYKRRGHMGVNELHS